ncbi:MAG: methyltransferase domain-containing protein [Alphaproteobacteria bacterium]|nr:methyltransferase domain-containing protein [Alphaproteobacteria bacterium]
MADDDYILGTNDAEIQRLGLQHRVWRPRMLDAWRRAGITLGQTVIDAGSGPGHATLDLAEIVGSAGRVVAVERSARFVTALRQAAAVRQLAHVTAIEGDITDTTFGRTTADALWCRWVFSWLTDPEPAVANIARAVKRGGVAVFHEYLDYASWGLAPHDDAFSAFVQAIIDSVNKTGATIDSALYLPRMLEEAGFDLVSLTPIVDIVAPDNIVWHWPTSFARSFRQKLVDDGLLTAAQAAAAIAALDRAESGDGTRMVTPILLEIIARKR